MSKHLRFKEFLARGEWGQAETALAHNPHFASKLDGHGRSLVGYAARDGRWDAVEWLLRRGWPAAHAVDGALRARDAAPAEVDAALWAGCKDEAELPRVGEATILDRAVAMGSGRWLSRILKESGWIISDQAWGSAWAVAIESYDEAVCDRLVEYGGAQSLRSCMGDLVAAAIRRDSLPALGWLLIAGMDVSGLDSNGLNPLGLAAKMRRARAVEWLLQAGADVDAVDREGHTALYRAVASGDEDSVRFLLAAGADPELRQGRNGQGDSPLRLAAKNGSRRARQAMAPELEALALGKIFANVLDSWKPGGKSGRL